MPTHQDTSTANMPVLLLDTWTVVDEKQAGQMVDKREGRLGLTASQTVDPHS